MRHRQHSPAIIFFFLESNSFGASPLASSASHAAEYDLASSLVLREMIKIIFQHMMIMKLKKKKNAKTEVQDNQEWVGRRLGC